MTFAEFQRKARGIPEVREFLDDPRPHAAIDCSLKRQRLRLTREQLASMLRCDVKYIERVESVDKTVSLEFIEEVISFLDNELKKVKEEQERRERLKKICRGRRLSGKK